VDHHLSPGFGMCSGEAVSLSSVEESSLVRISMALLSEGCSVLRRLCVPFLGSLSFVSP
jgi:hypothetical protein